MLLLTDCRRLSGLNETSPAFRIHKWSGADWIGVVFPAQVCNSQAQKTLKRVFLFYLPMWWLTSDSLYLIKGLEQLQLLLEEEKQEQSCSLQSHAFGKQRSGSASGAQQKEGPCCHLQPKETNRKQIPSTGFAPIFSDKVEADHRVNLGALSRGSIKTLNAFLTCTES